MEQTFRIATADDMMKFGELLAQKLRGGELLQLVGDVGAGKTTFVRGLAAGLNAKEPVSSPTFTICNSYHGRLIIHHCDFYRLHDDSLIEKELDELVDPAAVVVLEWAENIHFTDKIEHVTIQINVGENDSREIILSAPKSQGYLL